MQKPFNPCKDGQWTLNRDDDDDEKQLFKTSNIYYHAIMLHHAFYLTDCFDILTAKNTESVCIS